MTGSTPGTSVSQFLTAATKVLLQLLPLASSMCRTPSVALCCCCGAQQQHTWEALTASTTGTRSLPPVELHCLLRQGSQQVGLVHLHGTDVQHRQVSLQFLQQGAAASIPELWDRKHDCRVLLPHPKQSFSPKKITIPPHSTTNTASSLPGRSVSKGLLHPHLALAHLCTSHRSVMLNQPTCFQGMSTSADKGTQQL